MKLLKKPKLFYYCDDRLKFTPIKNHYAVLALTFLLSISISYFVGRETKIIQLNPVEAEILLRHINDTTMTFTADRLQSLILNLNIRYPYIVYAQSLLETGSFNSDIFLENHNLFGMKQARIRVNTAKGTHNGHAYYNTWQESVYDYAFYQCRYLYKINNEQEYYNYLGQRYAEDPDYVSKLKHIVKEQDLKKIFNVSSSDR